MPRRLVAAGLLLIALTTAAYAYSRWSAAENGEHYTPGTARINTYSLTDVPTQLRVFYASGWMDIVEQPVVVEDARSVRITIPTRVYVPCRGCFKQLSATLGDAVIPLRAPLGERSVMDGPTGRQIDPRSR